MNHHIHEFFQIFVKKECQKDVAGVSTENYWKTEFENLEFFCKETY